jgi:hypothetical protein
MALNVLASFLDIIHLKLCTKNSHSDCVLPIKLACVITVIVVNRVWSGSAFGWGERGPCPGH